MGRMAAPSTGERPLLAADPHRPVGERHAAWRRPAVEVRLLAVASLVAAALFYLPFALRAPSLGGIPFDGQGMERIHRTWDGPLYVTAAATLWDPDPRNPLYAWLGAPPRDYAERFPLYPLLIRLFSPVWGYWASALLINLAASTSVTLGLYAFLRRFGAVPDAAFWVALISIFWPPRQFLYRYVAMTEPLFVLGLLGAAFALKTGRYLACGLFGAVAVAARPNGFLVVAGFGLIALVCLADSLRRRQPREVLRLAPLLLMPATLLAIYAWHQQAFGDWLASVHATSFVRPEPRLFPALTFYGIGGEGVPFLFLLGLAGILELVRRGHWDLAVLSALFYLPTLLVPTDVSRYLMPVFPFTLFLAGERVLAAWPVRVAALTAIPVVYAYAWITLLHPGYQAPFERLFRMLP